MKVTRVICPACNSEENITSDKDNLHEYSSEIVSRICDKEECQRWDNSPEQRLLKAMFGERR